MIIRDFDAMLAEKVGSRPPFKVGGETFHLRAKLPYKRWNKLLAIMRDDDTSVDDANTEFFNTVLIKADRARFLALLDKDDDDDDEDAVIGLSQLDAIIEWVMEHFTGKLLPSSDSSPSGLNGTGPQPNVVSLSSRNAS